MIDMMLDAMKNEGITDDSIEDETSFEKDAKLEHKAKKEFDTVTLVATALVMLVAGYDTTAQTLSFCAYELATHEELQKRLQVYYPLASFYLIYIVLSCSCTG